MFSTSASCVLSEKPETRLLWCPEPLCDLSPMSGSQLKLELIDTVFIRKLTRLCCVVQDVPKAESGLETTSSSTATSVASGTTRTRRIPRETPSTVPPVPRTKPPSRREPSTAVSSSCKHEHVWTPPGQLCLESPTVGCWVTTRPRSSPQLRRLPTCVHKQSNQFRINQGRTTQQKFISF